jgi:hypothetical protein
VPSILVSWGRKNLKKIVTWGKMVHNLVCARTALIR